MIQTPTTARADPKPHIKLGSERGIYRMSSKSRRGTWHVVNVRRGRCSCDAGRHGRPCYHLAYCRQFDAALERARAKATQPAVRLAFAINPPVAPGEGMRALLECFV